MTKEGAASRLAELQADPELRDYDTIIVDEASMIDHLLHQDLLSFGIPILWVGDHGQLEPVGGQTNLMANPTLRLEHIHRQAADNPILRLAHAFREGRATPFWEDPKGRLTLTDSSYFDKFVCPERQIICGYNKTRHRVNKKVREQLNRTDLVEPGEKLICLRNSKRHGVFNGQQFTVVGILGETRRIIEVEVETAFRHQVRVHLATVGHPLYADTLYRGFYGPGAPRRIELSWKSMF